MNRAPAAQARNTNIAAEGNIMLMTDEEIQQTIQELSESIDKLSNSDKPLTKEERRHKNILLLRKETLQKIMEARKNNDLHREAMHAIDYGLLTTIAEKHPFVTQLIMSKLRMIPF